MRAIRLLPAAISFAAFVAVGFASTRALGNWAEYRARKRSDPSAAELSLDSAEIWGGAGLAALVVGAAAARKALRST